MRNKKLFFFCDIFFIMKLKIFMTIFLFLFSLYYLDKAIYFIRNNDTLMQEIKDKAPLYYEDAVDAIITQNTMIPGRNGKEINLIESYKKMKQINKFSESLIIYNIIPPNKTINNNYDKVIINGNITQKKVSIIINANNKTLDLINNILINDNIYLDIFSKSNYTNTNFKNKVNDIYLDTIDYCITNTFLINKECMINHKYTFLVENISNYHLSSTKEKLKNGKIFLYTFNETNYRELNLIIKYLKNNNYEIVSLDTLLST